MEIPARLLTYLEPGSRLGAVLHDTGRGSFILSGVPVTDVEALSQMDIPGHETCVEVGKDVVREESVAGGAATG